MATVFLVKTYSVLVDEIDADLANRKWHVDFMGRELPYIAASVDRVGGGRTTEKLHRVILERALGRNLKTSEHVDHIDNNPLNNTRANLRVATHAQNQANAGVSKNNKLGFKGVHILPSGRYRAAITVNKKLRHLGVYDTPEDAHQAYMEAAKHYFGEFARGE